MSNILLKHLLLKTAGQVGSTALNAATQARAEKRATAGVAAKRKPGAPCTPCAARSLVASVQRKVLG